MKLVRWYPSTGLSRFDNEMEKIIQQYYRKNPSAKRR